MLARLDPRLLERIWFPLGEQTKAETRAEAAAAGLAAARPRREPGGVLPRRRRLPRVPRAPGACAVSRARSSTRPARRVGDARRLLAVHARPAPRPRRLGSRAALRRRDGRAHEHRRRRPARVARAHPRRGEGPSALLPVGRVTAKLRYRSPAVAATVERTASGFRLTSTSRRTASRAGRPPCSTTATSSSGPDWSRPRRLTSVALRDRRLLLRQISPISPSRSSSSPSGSGVGWAFLRLAVTFDRLSSLIRGAEREVLPVINKVGGSVDRVNAQLDKLDTGDRQRRRRSRGRRRSGAHRQLRGQDARCRSSPVSRPASSHGWASFRTRRNWREAVDEARQRPHAASSDLDEELKATRD